MPQSTMYSKKEINIEYISFRLADKCGTRKHFDYNPSSTM